MMADNLRGILRKGSPYSFLGLEKSEEAFAQSRVVILPVPYDGTTTYQSGTREGPRAIISASKELETFDEEILDEPCRIGIFTLDELDITVKSPEEMVQRVSDAAKMLLELGKFPVMIGGEHLMTLGMVKALVETGKQDFGILHLDAHGDLRSEYQGSSVSNACVMKLASLWAPVVSVGIRSITRDECEYAARNNIPIFFCYKLKQNLHLWEEVLRSLPEKIYITIDLDVLDPGIMPSVGTPEPGGLEWYEITLFLKKVFTSRKIIGFDIMELKPIGGLVAPDFLAAKLLYKLVGYLGLKT